MNCPNCGAENEVGARFCVECGAPLETQLNMPDRPPEVDDEEDDRTIFSSVSRVSEEDKTMAVTQDQLGAAEAGSSFSPEPDPTPIPPAPSIGGGGISGGGSTSGGGGNPGWMNQRNIIIAVVVLLLLCCCCCALSVGVGIGSDPDTFEDIIRELSAMPVSLWAV